MPSIINDEEEPIDPHPDDMSEDMIEENEPEDASIMVEDLDPDEPLFEGGPTASQIIEWKKEHKGVYITEVSWDDYIVWRTIKRGEYRHVVSQIAQLVQEGTLSDTEINMYNEELICQLCVLHPKLTQADFDDQLAGMPVIVSQQILECSGFRPIDTRGL